MLPGTRQWLWGAGLLMSCAELLPCRAGLPWWCAGPWLLCAGLARDDLGCGSMAAATVDTSACLDDAPSCGMTTNVSTLEDNGNTNAMVVGACGW